MNQEDIIRMAREVGITMSSQYGAQWEANTEDLEAFAKLVAAAERADMRKGFAGVTLWLGAGEVTQLVTETQIKYERNQGDALTLAAQKCLDIYAGARGDTK